MPAVGAPPVGWWSVVDDLERQRVGLVAHRHRSTGRARVLEDVGERLLDDPVRRQVDAGRELTRGWVVPIGPLAVIVALSAAAAVAAAALPARRAGRLDVLAAIGG